jgi:hypothetical protein
MKKNMPVSRLLFISTGCFIRTAIFLGRRSCAGKEKPALSQTCGFPAIKKHTYRVSGKKVIYIKAIQQNSESKPNK